MKHPIRGIIKVFAVLYIFLFIVVAAACTVNKPTDSSHIQTTNAIKKTFYDEIIPQTAENELSGIVYNSYILKDLREHEFGWDVFNICESLDINVVINDDEHDIYNNYGIPINFYIEKNNVRLTFKAELDKLDEIYLKNPEEASIYYQVAKNNSIISLEHVPVNYKSRGVSMDIYELLDALNIKYYNDESVIYIDSLTPTPILGKIFASEVKLSSGEKLEFKLIYNYKSSSDTSYKSIDLSVIGSKNTIIHIFDENSRGCSDYYDSGYVDYLYYSGEDLLQLNLGRDTIIYKYQNGDLVPLFSKEHYQKYTDGCFTLETDENGNCSFHDKINGIVKNIEGLKARPNAVYNVRFSYFDRMEQDYKSNDLKLAANFGAVMNGRYFFTAELEFVYANGSFTPRIIRSTNWPKYDNDKASGIIIKSMDQYRWFEYKVN